jgi:outer membrane protein assembly factor BamB
MIACYTLDLDGHMIWKTELNGKIRSSSPCLSNDNDDDCDDLGFPSVYIGTQSGNLYRINKDNGAILWFAHLESPLLSSPSKIHQHILVGTSDGHLHCVRSTNGSSIWKYKTAGKIWSSPLLTRGLNVFVDRLTLYILPRHLVRPTTLEVPDNDMIDSSPSLYGNNCWF